MLLSALTVLGVIRMMHKGIRIKYNLKNTTLDRINRACTTQCKKFQLMFAECKLMFTTSLQRQLSSSACQRLQGA